MPIDASILVLTDEAGEEIGRYPVRKSALLQFERKHLRPFNENSPLDQAIMSFRTAHGRWPKDGVDGQHELDAWVDSVNIDTVPVTVGDNGNEPDPTNQADQPSS
jgi:hypothetical protein